MINLYKLLNTLEQGMSLFQLNKWKTEGIWYPNVFVPDQETYHIQLTGNYSDEEINDWITFLEDNQWKIYPLLANILKVFLPNGDYQILYTLYPQGFISVIAKPL